MTEKDLDKCVALAIINLQYGSHVPTSVTVVRCTKNGNHLLFLFQQKQCTYLKCYTYNSKESKWKRIHNNNYMSPVKSIHNKLMSSSNQLKAVCVIELFRYILKEIMSTGIKNQNNNTKTVMDLSMLQNYIQ